MHSPGYVAATDAAAREEFFADYKGMRDRIGAERGWPPMARGEYEREIERARSMSARPRRWRAKIAATVRGLGVSRFDLKYSAGGLAQARMLSCIELYAREVMPRVRALLAEA